MKNQAMMTTVVAVLVAVLAFFGGMKYQESKTGSNSSLGNNGGQFPQGGSGGGRFGRGNGLRPTVGQIISADANSITVKLQDGSSKIVILSDTTRIEKTSPALKADLTVGATVSAFGTANSDGSITAQNVQLNPGFRGGQGTRPQGMSGGMMPSGQSAQ